VNLNEWLNDVDGKTIGAGQCWDLAQDYSTRVTGGGQLVTRPSPHAGYAIGVWDGYGANGVERNYSQMPAAALMLPGWIPIWRFGSGVAPLSHIAVGLQDYGLGVQCVTQNPGGAHVEVLPKAGLAGYLVPRSGGTASGNVTLASDNNPVNGAVNAVSTVTAMADQIAAIQHFFAVPGQWQRIGVYALGTLILLAAVLYILKNNAPSIMKAVI
jgi:hypothetical protein